VSPAPDVPPQDHEIARRIRAGDRAAEEELVTRFEPGLLAIARIRAGRQAAGDLVQETLTIALPSLRKGAWTGEGALAAYLAAILRRQIQKAWGAKPASTDPVVLENVPAAGTEALASAERDEQHVRIRHALDRLDASHREVILRHYLDEQSVEAIARELGVPRGTVLSRLHYARRKLAKTLNRLERSVHT
jgi:RNA polymerase sigma-70 factor (ECF subfamily)